MPQCICARKALSRIERHRHANRIGKRGWHTVRLALLTYVPPRFGVSSRQAKEQQCAKRVNIAADARLPKPKLLGRRIGTRAKLDGVGVGAIAPNARDSQVNNHQRREGHASIGRIPHARYDDVRGFKVAVDYRYPRLPRSCKTSM